MKHVSILLFVLTLFETSTAQTWIVAEDTPFDSRYDDIVFANDLEGWSVNSEGKIYHTSDGGASWSLQFQNTSDEYVYFRSVDFINTEIGFACSLDSLHYKTVNGGSSWSEFQLDIPGPAEGICGLSHVGDYVFGVGAYYYPAFFIRSSDAGQTWEYFDMSAYADGLVECHFINENLGFAGGVKESIGAVLLKTTDGGETWTTVHETTGGTSYAWKIWFVNDLVAYTSVESWFGPSTEILKTTDGGDTWELLTVSENTNLDIQGIGFLNENYGWVGPRWKPLYETLDGGQTWNVSTGPSNINRFFMNTNGDLYASGHQIYKYSTSVGLNEYTQSLDHSINVLGNPIDEELKIELTLISGTMVKMGLYSIDGKLNKSLLNKRMEKGTHTLSIDVSEIASGNYVLFMRSHESFQGVSILKE